MKGEDPFLDSNDRGAMLTTLNSSGERLHTSGSSGEQGDSLREKGSIRLTAGTMGSKGSDVSVESSASSAADGTPASRKGKKKKNKSKSRDREKPDLDRSVSQGSIVEDIDEAVAGRRRSISPAAGNFIKVKAEAEQAVQDHVVETQARCGPRTRRIAKALIDENYLANVTAVVVVFDAWLTCYDIDSRAVTGGSTPALVSIASDLCLVVYTLELCLFFAVKGISIMKTMYKDTLFMIDLTVLICGYLESLLQALGMSEFFGRIGMLRLLRVARILRLTRILRKSQSLKELRRLLTMMATCMKALAWSFLICFGVMTFWAMLMVEIIHPIVRDNGSQYFADCEQCLRATSSVMDANLLLFKTVIAGDSWGLIAVPVIEDHPWTFIIFCGSQLTLVFGVLNLIVAVVVDTFAEARAHDVLNLAEELEEEMASDQKILRKIFERIDNDSSGTVTFDELMEGARKDQELQSRLAVMDIDEVDLQQLFDMIDTEGMGHVSPKEFIQPLSRWVRDSKTAPRFVKYNLMRLMHKHDEFAKTVDLRFEHLARTIDEMNHDMHELHGFGRTDSRSSSVESFSPEGTTGHSPKQFTPKVSSGRGSQSLQDQFRQIRMQKVEMRQPDRLGTDGEAEGVEQPPVSRRPGPCLVPSCQDSVKQIEEDIEASFERAMQVLRKSLSESMSALKQTSAITETTVQELLHSTSSHCYKPGRSSAVTSLKLHEESLEGILNMQLASQTSLKVNPERG